MATTIQLPNLLANWPWQRRINPHYEEARAETEKWVHNLDMFVDEASQTRFDKCQTPKLACLAYPYFDREQARSACDLLVFFYAYDENTDVTNPQRTRELADIVMDAVRNPEKARPEGECPIGELSRQFWLRARAVATPMAQKHFIETLSGYVYSVVDESDDRLRGRMRSVDDYWELRRLTSGCLPSFAFMELSLDFPEEVYNHPLLEKLRDCATLAISAGNDIYSFNMERARGHDLHNIVTVTMNETQLDLQPALDYLGGWYEKDVVSAFLAAERAVREELFPTLSEDIVRQLNYYINGLGDWVRGCDSWHFEGLRHFGVQGVEIQKTRRVQMLPRQARDMLAGKPGFVETLDAELGIIRDIMHRDRAAGLDIVTRG